MYSAPSGVRPYKILFVIMVLMALLPHPAWAKTHTVKHHRHVRHHSLVDRTASYSDIIIDAESGRILHATAPDAPRHPASLTKMMTLYLTFQALESERISLNQYIPVSYNAAEQSPSKLGLRAGSRIKVEDAILGIVTESANDAAMALGEWLGGSEQGFARMMTRQAQALGMTRTHFNNPTGLPNPGQMTTARDMVMLGHAIVYHFPQYYDYFSKPSFEYAGITHMNHNHLMSRYDGMDGIKTGYIRSSGFNLVASVKRDDTRLIGAIFGGKSALARDNRMALLFDQAFVASQNETAPRVASAEAGEGDSSDTDDGQYVALPAKVASLFPDAPIPAEEPAASPPPTAATRNTVKKNNDIAGDWGIQVGAYDQASVGRASLKRLSHALPQMLGSATPVVERVRSGPKKHVYRARLMGLDEKTAHAVCAYIVKQKGGVCVTVGP
jgi:D-alanyl-D-alanine carboxypeptidase